MSERSIGSIPRVVFAGFASCFGCQINITNIEKHLLDVLGQIDMRYWQLTSSDRGRYYHKGRRDLCEETP